MYIHNVHTHVHVCMYMYMYMYIRVNGRKNIFMVLINTCSKHTD